MARPMVKKTWVWMTSEARPGEMSERMARKSRPNWPTPSSTPKLASVRQPVAGRAMKGSRGSEDSAKRSAAKAKGGSSARPQRMTTKLVPQTATTARASSR
jgi:hypothetical protein